MVIDTRASLARCAEGMSWNGKTCSGQAEVFSYKQAMTHAAERNKAENLRWRLPRVNELKRLLDRSSKPQGLNPELFPNAPRDWHWTGTAAVNAQRLNTYNYAQVDNQQHLRPLGPAGLGGQHRDAAGRARYGQGQWLAAAPGASGHRGRARPPDFVRAMKKALPLRQGFFSSLTLSLRAAPP
jgi:hypothetical protein